MRKIYGARLGTIVWNSTADLSAAMSHQKLTNADLKNSSGAGLTPTYYDDNGQLKQLDVYGNIHATNVYIGGSLTWIRNVAVSFDKYDDGIDDGILTVFFDIMFAPSLTLDPVTYQNQKYSTDAIKLSTIGVRAGIDGKFNRTLSWSYGGELGYRPTISGQGFFAMFKISFPLYSTNLDQKVESFGK
ncbi:MAG: hypothetical protein QM734_08295 [Cyclobacteriaceae bacterium]